MDGIDDRWLLNILDGRQHRYPIQHSRINEAAAKCMPIPSSKNIPCTSSSVSCLSSGASFFSPVDAPCEKNWSIFKCWIHIFFDSLNFKIYHEQTSSTFPVYGPVYIVWDFLDQTIFMKSLYLLVELNEKVCLWLHHEADHKRGQTLWRNVVHWFLFAWTEIRVWYSNYINL